MRSLLHLLVEEFVSLLDASVEERPVLHDVLDVLDGEVDEHAGDLGGELLASELLHEVEDGIANGLLHVLVLGLDGGDQLGALGVEVLLGLRHVGVLSHVGLGSLGLLHHWWGHGRHSRWWGLRHGGLVVLGAHLATLVVVVARVLLGLGVVGHTAVSLGVTASLVVVSLLVVVAESTRSLALLLLAAHDAHTLLEGKGAEELSDLEVELVARGDLVPLVAGVVHLLEPLEAKLILGLLISDRPVLGELVVADGELTSVHGHLGEVLEGLLGHIGGLEADEGVGLGSFNGEDLDGLDLTEATEDFGKALLGRVVLDVLDVQVASLL